MMMEMWSFVLLCAAFAITLCHGQVPQPCFSPSQLTFKAVSFNHRLTEFRYYLGEYDYPNRRIVFKGESSHKGHKSYHWIIMLYKEKTIYEIDLKTDACHKFDFKKFYRFGVPEKAKFEDLYDLGGPGESVEVEEWYEPHLFGGRSWVGVFTRKHCYPVNTFLLKNHRNETTSMFFSNVVEGTVNPEWYIPPKSCMKAQPGMASNVVSDLQGHIGDF